MRKMLCAAVTVVFFSALLHGCADTGQIVRDNPNTAVGIGAGVLGGAVVGGLLGGTRGAVVGGMIGGLAGGVIGNHMDEQEKSRAQTSREYGYSPSQGIRLRVESVRANPAVLSPGETINVNMTYAVLTTSSEQQVLVRETRDIQVNGASVGKTYIDIAREGGTWRSTVPITLPANAPKGNYRVIASVEGAGGSRDVGESFFKVQQ